MIDSVHRSRFNGHRRWHLRVRCCRKKFTFATSYCLGGDLHFPGAYSCLLINEMHKVYDVIFKIIFTQNYSVNRVLRSQLLSFNTLKQHKTSNTDVIHVILYYKKLTTAIQI